MTQQPSLRDYLNTKETQKADYNIVGWGPNWSGKYAIPESEYELFLEQVHAHVFVRNRACGLLERHKEQAPIIIDLDFRYAAGGPLSRRFNADHLREFVAAYADALQRFFVAPLTGPLQFFVMLKPGPEKDDKDKDAIKDGVHIVCPTLTTAPELQYAIRGYLLQTGVVERIFDSTGNTQPAQDCLDLSVIQRNSWFLYGACKPNKAWYKVENVYQVQIPSGEGNGEDENPVEALTADHLEEMDRARWTPAELVKLLSIRFGHDSPTLLQLRGGSTEGEWAQLLQRWGKGSNWAKSKSPGIFAKIPAAAGTEPAPLQLGGAAAPAPAASAADEMVQISGMSVRSGYTTADIALTYKLVADCLDPEKRCGDYNDWVKLGFILKNIANTDESFRSWADITRRLASHHKKSRMTEAELRAKWQTLPSPKAGQLLRMGTLVLWAKEDSPAAYRAMLNEANKNHAYLNDSGTHVSVADLLVQMYRNEFRCTPLKRGSAASSFDWYQFPSDGHTWRSLKTWMRLRERLSNEVRNVYMAADVEAAKREMATTEPSERERLQEKRKKLLKVETHLQTTNFKDSVMKEAAEKFYDEEFLNHMNMDPCLVGFSNGVLELRKPGDDGQPHVFFRPGCPDDCISFQMGRGQVGLDAIPYIPYDPAAPAAEHDELNEFFAKIYPDPVLREYCLTLFAACLEGANREQKFYIMTGVGSNGKSKIVELMSKTFGEYQETLSTTALTRKRADAGSANPELIVLKCRRFVSMSEPDEGEKINTASMKQLSGEDVVKARALFQDQDQFVIMARIFMLCNDLPPVSSMDNGTWRRLRVIPHVAKFVDPGVPTDPAQHVYTKDLLLEGKIARWRPYFAGMLVWYYENRYLRSGLKEPAQVAAASMKYKEENDAFAAFSQDCLIREVGAECRSNDVLVRYKEWARFNPGKKQLQKKDILQKMAEVYGGPVDSAGKVFAGVRIAEEGEDISGNVVL
jgi:P4 family phage/plasmid primase-like protien